MSFTSRIPHSGCAFVGGYLILWSAATAYLAAKGADWTLPAISLVVFGVALPLLSLPLTRKAAPPQDHGGQAGVGTVSDPRFLGLLCGGISRSGE